MDKYDFSGWATRNNLLCADGRTIRKDAFKDNDGQIVPLVFGHQHNDVNAVLGHALLENRDEGIYAYCSFNDTESGQAAKKLVQHGDVASLSIYANNLKQVGGDVVHGVIRELSLVLAGANPGAYIETVMAHSEDGAEDNIESLEAGWNENIVLYHSDDASKITKEDTGVENKKPEQETDETIGDIFNTFSDKQKEAVYAIVAAAMGDNGDDNEDYEEGDDESMKHNVFDQDDQNQQNVLTHDAMQTIIGDGKRYGSLKESFLAHAAEYGIDQIDMLFPEYQSVNGNQPEFIKRTPDGWVDTVMNGVHHTPFSRIKMTFADIRGDEARARGYMKGNLKKEEVFGLLKRVVEPTTIYKKQKLDRDDTVDITDFDVVAWLKSEMRMMLDEEIARAIVFGDGRSALSEDKISEKNIIPIYNDADLYTIKKTVTKGPNEALAHAIITEAVKAQDEYEGSGNTTFFTSASTITDMLLLEDTQGHRMYKDMNELALAMNVNKIIRCPASIIPENVIGVIVDLSDYNVGADKGGSINMFEDFDIDYNQMKYLIETRCSGALVKPFSAITLKKNS